jgi:hypothetical protein
VEVSRIERCSVDWLLRLGWLLCVAACSASGPSVVSSTPDSVNALPVMTEVRVRIVSQSDTNCGRLMRVVVRETSQVDFERASYADLMTAEEGTEPGVLASKLILPGGKPEFEIHVSPGASFGVFVLLTESTDSRCETMMAPAKAWKRWFPGVRSGETSSTYEFHLGARLSGIHRVIACGELE